jgi:hypothetical protein
MPTKAIALTKEATNPRTFDNASANPGCRPLRSAITPATTSRTPATQIPVLYWVGRAPYTTPAVTPQVRSSPNKMTTTTPVMMSAIDNALEGGRASFVGSPANRRHRAPAAALGAHSLSALAENVRQPVVADCAPTHRPFR